MKLYHFTCADQVLPIKEHGLLPSLAVLRLDLTPCGADQRTRSTEKGGSLLYS